MDRDFDSPITKHNPIYQNCPRGVGPICIFNSPDSPTPSSKYKATPSQPPPHPNLCSRVSLFDSNPEMPYSREGRSVSPANSGSPIRGRRSRSRSRSRSLSRSRRSRSRSRDSVDAVNPGNNLYVTGLSTRVNASDLEKYFNSEGKVVECHLVTDPRTRESRGFGFVTMETVEDADRCIKYLNRSVLEGRLITVEKAKRRRGRTPTPGRYHGLRERRGRGGRRRSRSYSPRRWQDRDPYARDRRGRSRSPYGRRSDDYSDSNRRRRERSLSGAGRDYP